MEQVTIRLTRAEFTALLLMSGYAVAAARAIKDDELARTFTSLSNAINRDNPNWTPLAVPKEKKKK
jgi:hypothetical protein